MVDTNSDPNTVDYVIPANDDATKSIEVVLGAVCEAMNEGLQERKVEKLDAEAAEEAAPKRERKAKSAVKKSAKKDDEVAATNEETAEKSEQEEA